MLKDLTHVAATDRMLANVKSKQEGDMKREL
jgi:hypothetical protein